MNILYFSFWGISDGLTVSTVIPHVRILGEFTKVKKIVLVTTEREDIPIGQIQIKKTEHLQVRVAQGSLPIINRIKDFAHIPEFLSDIARQKKIDLIIGRGSPAGAVVYKVWRKTGIRFYVESFEPHADYMQESGVWQKWDLRYLFLKNRESKIKSYASGIITVSQQYRDKLRSEISTGLWIESAPCGVDLQKFSFDLKTRHRIREKYGIPEHWVTGIYVGKFGDLYYDAEAFLLFKTTFSFFKGNFFLIIISSESLNQIRLKLEDVKFPINQALFFSSDHEKIPLYLSASDFGFAPIRKAPSKLFCSPVKTGEYWANGLPVLLTRGIGDESVFIEDEQGGAIFDIEDPIPALEKIKVLINDPAVRQKIPQLALKYRSFNSIRNIYEKIIHSE